MLQYVTTIYRTIGLHQYWWWKKHDRLIRFTSKSTLGTWLHSKSTWSCVVISLKHNKQLWSQGTVFFSWNRNFSLFERAKKTAESVVPSDWKAVIENAKLYRPFTIIEMDQADIKDVNVLSKEKSREKCRSLGTSGLRCPQIIQWYTLQENQTTFWH